MADFDWQSFIFDSKRNWMGRLHTRARHRFRHDDTYAEEAYTFALEKLSENNWQRLRDYRKDSNPDTFLLAVYNRLLQDFDRTRSGRLRPPKWLSDMGASWVRVWELLCRSRREPETVVDHLCARGDREPGSVRAMMRTIKARIPTCGQATGQFAFAEVPEPTSDAHDTAHSQEPATDKPRLVELLLAISALLADQGSAPATSQAGNGRADELASAITTSAEGLCEAFALTDEERLLLRLRYEENLAVARIARDLGRKEHQVRRELKAIEGRIVDALAAHGITRDVLRGLLGD